MWYVQYVTSTQVGRKDVDSAYGNERRAVYNVVLRYNSKEEKDDQDNKLANCFWGNPTLNKEKWLFSDNSFQGERAHTI